MRNSHDILCLCITFKDNLIMSSVFMFRFLFTFCYPYMIDKVLFLAQIFKMKILIDLKLLRSPESEYNTFSDWSVHGCVCPTKTIQTTVCIKTKV